jgi:hypothetical protein
MAVPPDECMRRSLSAKISAMTSSDVIVESSLLYKVAWRVDNDSGSAMTMMYARFLSFTLQPIV